MIIWRIITRFLKLKERDYLKHFSVGKDIFVIHIYRHVPVEEMMEVAANSGVLAAMDIKEEN